VIQWSVTAAQAGSPRRTIARDRTCITGGFVMLGLIINPPVRRRADRHVYPAPMPATLTTRG